MATYTQDTYRQLSPTNGGPVKHDREDEEEANDDTDKRPRHRRNYQACEPCRERKVKCHLGDVDNPSKGPCAKCAREGKTCWFRETRKKDAGKQGERLIKRPRTDSMHSDVAAAPRSGSMSSQATITSNVYAYPTNHMSPTRPLTAKSSPAIGTMNMPQSLNGFGVQPRSVPNQISHSNGTYTSPSASNMHAPFVNSSPVLKRTVDDDNHVVLPQAKSLSHPFTNTTDNMSMLVRAATTTDTDADPHAALKRQRTLTGSAGEADLSKLSPVAARARSKAREDWSQMRFVRAGWFSADEALDYVEYFYTHLQPMTPVVVQNYRDPSRHRQLLSEEPVLALAILSIASRYHQLTTSSSISRGYYIHEKLWDALRKIVQRLLWGQEQFGGGFTGAGMVPTQETATGQITWKGSLRTLGTIEALLLLTDWQPRALHFPPGDDENKLVGAGFALLDDEKPRPADNSGQLPYATWLEPAWRSDRMSWMLLGLAQSLSFELGVFDKRHERCVSHGPDSECMRRRRIRRLVITYVSQISGRIGIQPSLSPEQDIDPRGCSDSTAIDYMQKLWFDIAHIMHNANRDIFPSRDFTTTLVESGRYKDAIAKLKPNLDRWMDEYNQGRFHFSDAMQSVLRMEYEYARLYINSLGLQKVIGEMVLQDKKTNSRGLSAHVGPVHDDNKQYIDEVRDAAYQILYASCYVLGENKVLGYSPVRTFLRTLSAMMFSLKMLVLGSEEREVRKTFKILRDMTKRMTEQVADDVHLSPHAAKMVQQIMADVQSTMVRIPKPGSRGQSRAISPNLHHTNGSMSVSTDQESPDALSSIPVADYNNQTLIMPTNFDINFDTNMNFDNVDPGLFTSGDDWISMPLDNLFSGDINTVNQGYGGIGPTFGDRDMLSVVTGTQLDQNQGPGLGNNFPAFQHF